MRATATRSERPPGDPTDAVAWAIESKPEKWELGEWLSHVMPEGSWDEMEADAIANYIVGAAVRSLHSEPPA